MEDQQPRRETAKREVARIASISDISEGRYVVQDGWLPNYVLLPRGEKASRVNVCGVIVGVDVDEKQSPIGATLDDGTGTIHLRTFDDNRAIKGIDVGHSVRIVARPRVYSNEIYLFPEIVKTISDPAWIRLRKKELDTLNASDVAVQNPSDKADAKEDEQILKEKEDSSFPKQEIKEIDMSGKGGEDEDINSVDSVLMLIRKLDTGDGADTQEVIDESKEPDVQKIIDSLLKMGDVFEVAGRLKVLE